MSTRSIGVTKPAPPLEYVFSRVELGVTGCWDWIGTTNKAGYGVIGAAFWRKGLAHRWVFNEFVRELEPIDSIHHTCKNRRCVNPQHLQRFKGHGHHILMHNTLTTHCKRGHARTEENTNWWFNPKSGVWDRRCLVCHRRQTSKYYWKKKLHG